MLSAWSQRRGTVLTLGAHVFTLVLVAYVALVNISLADYSPDELVYANCGTQLATTTTFCNAGHPPLAKMWFGFFEWIFGNSISVARSANGVVAVLSAVVIYFFIRHISNWKFALVGAGLWGLTPQWGSNGQQADLVVRISRYALLEPMLCLFIVLTLYAGYRWAYQGSTRWVVLCGAAATATVMSKEIGFVVVPVLLLVPAVACWTRVPRRIVSDSAWLLLAVVATVLLVFSAFGPVGGYRDFVQFAHALTHNNGLVGESIYRGHLYRPPPWWLSLRYAILGVGVPLAVVLIGGVAMAFSCKSTRFLATYCSAASAVTVIALIISAREINFYWLAWEPPLLVAAVAGWAASISLDWRRWFVAFSLAVCAVVSLATVIDVSTLRPGPYQRLGQRVHCVAPCVALSVGRLFIPSLYGVNTVQGLAGSNGVLIQGLNPLVVLPSRALLANEVLPNVIIFDANSVDYLLAAAQWNAIRQQLRRDGFHRIFHDDSLTAYTR
jgi:4-amino-4-deoxy-L-arabinose transferase-like glycosyltransferase